MVDSDTGFWSFLVLEVWTVKFLKSYTHLDSQFCFVGQSDDTNVAWHSYNKYDHLQKVKTINKMENTCERCQDDLDQDSVHL